MGQQAGPLPSLPAGGDALSEPRILLERGEIGSDYFLNGGNRKVWEC